ncbi:DUF2075 domain-containing protein [Lactococcus petauri]|uniref:DUF2075 domain-containing protein n=11 Tax=Lactococcus petauri TaxID=1940789 RepID=A0ABZ2SEI2_9LACT|nr:DUF2075 domain-containing protein [Lactococcus petauri]OAL08587.1 GIY-YIG catalytic domain protein [Lactococcus garvieae]MCI3871736.1 DUF2075 domain-containing protein [Lactococcus petauri]MCQ8275738.1 hypothetical protein [Lactococcus petauri]MCR6589669.1 DUF2075 domain-containing protein [Lactococcus petauri]MCU7363916.1 DUF2075 domain-containing protein [Lactococcus petauri]
MEIEEPIIYEVTYNENFYKNFQDNLYSLSEKDRKYIENYPTVYVIYNKVGKIFTIYIGETIKIKNRTYQHLKQDVKFREDFKSLADAKNSMMIIIAHHHFNKSLTLDIENRLMHYLSSKDNTRLYNRSTNPQDSYYLDWELEEIFSKIWEKLRLKNSELFPNKNQIKESALFKNSPFHKLTSEQLDIRQEIIIRITSLLSQNKTGQLLLIDGEAGSGKTVLMSSLFYELSKLSQKNSENPVIEKLGKKQYLLVNHDEQLKVYRQLVQKLKLSKTYNETVAKPTHFIKTISPKEKVDIVIIDEAHLLWTQGKQAYQGKNHLKDILERAKVVVAVFDKKQVLSREQYISNEEYLNLVHTTNLENNYFHLENQLRINASHQTINWIRTLIDKQEILPIPYDEQYDLKVFDNSLIMYEALRKKSLDEEKGLSRLIATFDWPYTKGKKNTEGDYWMVTTKELVLPWNLQLPVERTEKNKAWAEQKQTINEVGSTFTIQGFDLNIAGVIIGPSVKYRNGKIVFDSSESKNIKATQRRKIENGEMLDVSDYLLKNELNVLLTRGVNGLYIYAVDKELRMALSKAQRGEI